MKTPGYTRVGPVRVWRCTEAVDARSNYAFRTIGNVEGRCIEIVAPQNTMLFDRRLARQVAEAILEMCGPDEEIPSDLAQADTVQVIYDDRGEVAGFVPYVPPPVVPRALSVSAFARQGFAIVTSEDGDIHTRI